MTDEDAFYELDQLIREGDAARTGGRFDEALESYKKALMISTEEEELERASIYTGIAETKRAQSKTREAESNYEKALALMPGYKPALVALVDLATDEKDFRRVAQLRKRLADAAVDDESRVRELKRLADVQRTDLKDSRAAIESLERARDLRPDDLEMLRTLRQLYENIHRWPKVVETLGAICTETEDARERGLLRFAQADIALGRLRDEPRGLGFLEAALEEDPTHEKALVALVAVRTRASQWAELERVYARLIDRHAERGDADRAFDLCKRLGMLRRDKLGDGPGAVDAFTGATKLRPSDSDTRGALAELLIAKGDVSGALSELEATAAAAPSRAQTWRRLFEIHTKRGNHDRAFLSALALEELGSAELDHQLLVDQLRPEGALRPVAALDDSAWDVRLRAPGHDPLLEAMMAAVAAAAVKAKVEELESARKLTALDPRNKQDKTSTVTIVRAFVWASTVLGITTPEVYVLGDVPGGIAAVQLASPTTAVGPEVLRGLSLADLVFLVARHLAYYRPEHYPLVFYSTLPELTTLFFASLKLALPDVTMPSADAVTKLRKRIAAHISADEREALVAAAKKLDAAGGRVDLGAWIRSVEITANRAGLVLSGDFHAAMKRVKGEKRAIADVSVEERRLDLIGYLASAGHADLRKQLYGRNPSQRPPPPQPDA
ncbi:MAG TPA: tetratricopeptide repeat protein [Polyangiaceae bacterium]|jgi:tetratricopeptide (TPR) repeat protein